MPLQINEDGSLPMWMDSEGRRHLVQTIEDAIVGGGDGGGPHTHPETDVTNLTTDLSGKASAVHGHAQADVTGLVTALSGKAPTAHTHAQSDTTNLVTDLAGKAASGHNHDAAYSGTGHTHAYAPTSHSHADGDLPAGLARDAEVAAVYAPIHAHPYAATSHAHAQSDVTNLSTSLAGKSDTSHVHANDHARQHSITSASDHTFPGGTTNFLRADGTFAAPPAGQGSGEAYAVGDLYITTRSGDPATLLGYGTWSRFGAGRFLLLSDTTAGVEAGSATHSHSLTQPTAANESAHTHTYTQTVNHVHVQTVNSATTGGLSGYGVDTSTNTPAVSGYSTQNPTGGVAQGTTAAGSAHTHTLSGGAVADGSTDPLSITAFAWLRTA